MKSIWQILTGIAAGLVIVVFAINGCLNEAVTPVAEQHEGHEMTVIAQSEEPLEAHDDDPWNLDVDAYIASRISGEPSARGCPIEWYVTAVYHDAPGDTFWVEVILHPTPFEPGTIVQAAEILCTMAFDDTLATYVPDSYAMGGYGPGVFDGWLGINCNSASGWTECHDDADCYENPNGGIFKSVSGGRDQLLAWRMPTCDIADCEDQRSAWGSFVAGQFVDVGSGTFRFIVTYMELDEIQTVTTGCAGCDTQWIVNADTLIVNL